ncbi:MAG: hypothetical protein ABMB14_27165 [Myxococcota bacterium]
MVDEQARAGLKAIEEHRYDDAVRALTAAVAGAADRPDLNHALGIAHLRRGDVGNGVPFLESAVRLAAPYTDPRHQPLRKDFQLTLATAYQVLDRVRDAERTLVDGIAAWPDAIEARLQLGQLLLSSCRPVEACRVYDAAVDWLDKEQRVAAEALVGTVRAFLASGHDASVFLEAHGDSYRAYFDQVADAQAEHGWYAEAARMSRGADGELRPVVPDGVRPYALVRVDLVNPADGAVSGVYSEQEPMIVAIDGLEPLAQVPVTLPWPGYPFEVWVSSRCPWHWLSVVVELAAPAPGDERIGRVDGAIGSWYLAGYNGEFGDADRGRFHYVTDPEPVGAAAVAYTVDLGRAGFHAIRDLLRRLAVVHDATPIRRVLFGEGRIPE